jgi:hypothetical protein
VLGGEYQDTGDRRSNYPLWQLGHCFASNLSAGTRKTLLHWTQTRWTYAFAAGGTEGPGVFCPVDAGAMGVSDMAKLYHGVRPYPGRAYGQTKNKGPEGCGECSNLLIDCSLASYRQKPGSPLLLSREEVTAERRPPRWGLSAMCRTKRS